MDRWLVHVKSNAFLLTNSFPEKPICLKSTKSSMAIEIRVSRKESWSSYCRYRSVCVRAAGKKNPPSNSSSPHSQGNSDQSKAGGDGLKGNNSHGSEKFGDTSSNKSSYKPVDWREFRELLYIQEQVEKSDSVHNQDKSAPKAKSLPLKWAHPISAPENGCLLIATEKLDGVRTFERTVVLLLRSGTRNPQEGPFGIVINRPLHKKMKHMNPTNSELATTFADCSLHFGGPLDASMFLLRAGETVGVAGFEEVIPGVYFGSRNSLDEASGLVKKGGYAGFLLDMQGGSWTNYKRRLNQSTGMLLHVVQT